MKASDNIFDDGLNLNCNEMNDGLPFEVNL